MPWKVKLLPLATVISLKAPRWFRVKGVPGCGGSVVTVTPASPAYTRQMCCSVARSGAWAPTYLVPQYSIGSICSWRWLQKPAESKGTKAQEVAPSTQIGLSAWTTVPETSWVS